MVRIRMKIFFSYLIFLCEVWTSIQTDTDTLELVHVFFRHGARTPQSFEMYPNDPYKADTFLPMGFGRLTKLGKKQAFDLGKILRRRYDEFLGEVFYPDMVFARSTDYSRTRMSAQLLLAGLFPPSPSDIWNEELPWQPIPVNYERSKEDTRLLIRAHEFCPKFVREYNSASNSEEIKDFLKRHRDDLEYMTNHTGKKIETVHDGFFLYQTLLAEDTMNLTLADWTKRVYPDILAEFLLTRFILENYTPTMRRLQGGRIWQQMLRNMIAKSEKKLRPEKIKMILYSGHDHNLYSTLAAFDLISPHLLEYGAAVIVELHRLKGEKYAVKILYSRTPESEMEVLRIANCEEMCPLKEFVTLTKNLIPGNYTADCESLVDLDARIIGI